MISGARHRENILHGFETFRPGALAVQVHHCAHAAKCRLLAVAADLRIVTEIALPLLLRAVPVLDLHLLHFLAGLDRLRGVEVKHLLAELLGDRVGLGRVGGNARLELTKHPRERSENSIIDLHGFREFERLIRCSLEHQTIP